jgi:hypothetical protein
MNWLNRGWESIVIIAFAWFIVKNIVVKYRPMTSKSTIVDDRMEGIAFIDDGDDHGQITDTTHNAMGSINYSKQKKSRRIFRSSGFLISV